MAKNGRGFLHRYRTYNFIDKDPIIAEMRKLIREEGLMAKLDLVHQLSGVSVSTLHNWFDGDTKSPQNRTVQAIATSLGYEAVWTKNKKLDIERELAAAKRWQEKQQAEREEAEKRVRRAPGRTEHRARA